MELGGEHSRIAPSAMHLTLACPGSLQLQEQTPAAPDTEEILEGRAAHHIAAFAAASGVPHPIGHKFNHAGRDWTVTPDMYDGAALWASVVSRAAHIEQKVACKRIHPECWGTPDAWQFWQRDAMLPRALLRVWDYKYGHRWVDAFQNLQLGTYAIGILESLDISPGDDSVDVELIVVQPRAYHRSGPVQTYSTTAFALNDAVLKPARAAVVSALVSDPITNTSPACLDCKARHACGTLQRAAANVIDFSMTADLAPLSTHTAATELAIVDEAMERLKARRTGLFGQCEAAARAGERVPFYSMQPGKALLKWNPDVTVAEVDQLGAVIGLDLKKPAELLTPTQAGDLLHRKGVDRKVIDQYATRQPGGVSLKRDDDTARKVFAHNAGKP